MPVTTNNLYGVFADSTVPYVDSRGTCNANQYGVIADPFVASGGNILTEAGDSLITESNNNLITE